MKTKTILTALIGLLALSVLVFQACKKEDDLNKAPSCEITAPSNGEEFMQGEIITISVAATASDGKITEVKFYIGGESKGSVSISPYNYDWNTGNVGLGDHTIKAKSTDNDGASTSDEVTIKIIEKKITAFKATPTNGNAPLTVNFTDQSTNSPTSWHWDFGDGNTSSEQNPSNIYNNAGIYTVALTVSGKYGTDTESKIDFIVVSIPLAVFSANTTGGTRPLPVSFSDESINNPTSWLWDFGDGSSSTEQNPSHTYNGIGLYNVSLTASNEYGSDTETKTDFITVNGGSSTSLTDARDGQSYNIVSIGNLSWFAENLNYESPDSWCYEDDPSLGEIYGRLYTWDVSPSACPAGWRLPTDEEWKILEGTVDSQYGVGDPEWDRVDWYRGKDAGAALKSQTGWNNNNGTDLVGFAGLPGGYRNTDGFCDYLGKGAYWWSANEASSASAFQRGISGSNIKSGRGIWAKGYGVSVRCVRD